MGPKDDTTTSRQSFIGGSDARIIMGEDEAALLRLWREKRGEVEPEDLSGNLIVQLGLATEELNRRWYEANTGLAITDVQRQVRHPTVRWMGATLDGRIEATEAVFEAKFMLPWSFSEEAAAEKHMAQLQHNMWVVAARTAVLSVMTGGGKWVEITTRADPLYQHLIVTAERKFWRTSRRAPLRRSIVMFSVSGEYSLALPTAATESPCCGRRATASMSSFTHEPLQILTVRGFSASRRQAAQSIGSNEFFQKRNFFRTADQEPLPMLNGPDEFRCLE